MDELAGRLNNADFVLEPDVPQLVSVAGIIGVGKTTLAKKLSQLLDCKLLVEAYDTNPFLADVYAGRRELALDSQLHFLTSRVSQLGQDALPPGQIAVTDYVFDKELIYAQRLLNAQQLALYEKIHQTLSEQIAMPVLVVYLQDSAEKCLARIRRRNRPYEQGIVLKFLKNLSGDYEQLFGDWKASPVIRLGMSDFDCSEDGNVEDLAAQIRHYVAVYDYSYGRYKRKKPQFES